MRVYYLAFFAAAVLFAGAIARPGSQKRNARSPSGTKFNGGYFDPDYRGVQVPAVPDVVAPAHHGKIHKRNARSTFGTEINAPYNPKYDAISTDYNEYLDPALVREFNDYYLRNQNGYGVVGRKSADLVDDNFDPPSYGSLDKFFNLKNSQVRANSVRQRFGSPVQKDEDQYDNIEKSVPQYPYPDQNEFLDKQGNENEVDTNSIDQQFNPPAGRKGQEPGDDDQQQPDEVPHGNPDNSHDDWDSHSNSDSGSVSDDDFGSRSDSDFDSEWDDDSDSDFDDSNDGSQENSKYDDDSEIDSDNGNSLSDEDWDNGEGQHGVQKPDQDTDSFGEGNERIEPRRGNVPPPYYGPTEFGDNQFGDDDVPVIQRSGKTTSKDPSSLLMNTCAILCRRAEYRGYNSPQINELCDCTEDKASYVK